MNNRIPNPEFVDHYEFEMEVLSINQTNEVNIFQQLLIGIIWFSY